MTEPRTRSLISIGRNLVFADENFDHFVFRLVLVSKLQKQLSLGVGQNLARPACFCYLLPAFARVCGWLRGRRPSVILDAVIFSRGAKHH